MTHNTAGTVAQANANLNARQTEAKIANDRYAELQAEFTELQNRLSELGVEKQKGFTAMTTADHAVYLANKIAEFAKANEAANGRTTRAALIQAVETAVRPTLAYAPDEFSYGECIVNKLEREQSEGGLDTADKYLARTSVMLVKRNGLVAERVITEAQLKRAIQELERQCPIRDGGKLGIPYRLHIDDEAHIVR